jgi:hypothetical protein
MLEYHPELGWAVPHELDLGPMVPYTKQTIKLMGAQSVAGGAVYEVFKGGTDDGVSIPARYQTPWVPLADGDESRLRYLRAFGRGEIEAQLREDFGTVGEDYMLSFGQGFGFVWDVDLWNVGAWGDPTIEGSANTPLDQVCAHVSLMLSASTSTSANKPPLLGDGTAPEIGAWAVYGLKLDYIQLGT